MSSLEVPTRFKSSISITIIANSIFDFLIEMHKHIGLFKYPSFSKYSLRRLYHMRLDCFNLYRDCCNLIEHILRGFVLFASCNFNYFGIFIYIYIYIYIYHYHYL